MGTGFEAVDVNIHQNIGSSLTDDHLATISIPTEHKHEREAHSINFHFQRNQRKWSAKIP